MNPVRSIGLGLLVGPAIAFGILAAGSQSAHAATVAISVPGNGDFGHQAFRDRGDDFDDAPFAFDGGGFGDILITNSNRAEGGDATARNEVEQRQGVVQKLLDIL